jgi:hypothetical protein
MASRHTLGNEVAGSVDEQGEFEGADGRVELRPSVEQEIQARVDTNHPDAGVTGLTLEAEERLEAREWEIERTRVRGDRHQTSDREARSRAVAGTVSRERRRQFGTRAASVDPWADPDVVDAREQLSQDELAVVNQEAARIAERLERWSRAAVSRRLAERVVDGQELTSAVVATFEELQQAPGQVIPIALIGEVSRPGVDIRGTVETLWSPSHPSIAQVGLIADESGRTRFTVWKRSTQPLVAEGETVVFRNVSKSWYQGRVSVALTGWSRVEFPERERWWIA